MKLIFYIWLRRLNTPIKPDFK